MNVLLAEANVPYEKPFRPEDINPLMDFFDVCIIVRANDVTNPAAKDRAGHASLWHAHYRGVQGTSRISIKAFFITKLFWN